MVKRILLAVCAWALVLMYVICARGGDLTTSAAPATPAARAAASEDPCAHDETSLRCVTYVRNYDGDTITFNIHSVHPLIGKNIPIRVMGVDTAEIRTRDACEKRMALVAKEFVAELMQAARRIDLLNVQRCSFFRILADVVIDGRYLKDILLDKKFAYEYSGGRKPDFDWCELEKRWTAAAKRRAGESGGAGSKRKPAATAP